MSSASAGAKAVSMKPLAPNFVFNGFGGSERVDPFSNNSDDETTEEASRPQSKESVVPTSKLSSINNRLKSGGLRNFKLAK